MVLPFTTNNDVDYTEALLDLMPPGLLWIWDRFFFATVVQDVIVNGDDWLDKIDATRTIQDSIGILFGQEGLLQRLLSCFATELKALESHALALLNQTDPGNAVELLDDWERVLGLPEICYNGLILTLEERQKVAHGKLFNTFKTTNAQFYVDYAEVLGYDITIDQNPYDFQPRIMGVARMGVERMGGRGGFSILRITINSGPSDNELLKCAFNRVKQAHVIIQWVEP